VFPDHVPRMGPETAPDCAGSVPTGVQPWHTALPTCAHYEAGRTVKLRHSRGSIAPATGGLHNVMGVIRYDRRMDVAPVERFSSRAEAYASGRPGYPRELLVLLERDCGLRPAWRVADIGSGTGLLARLFLNFGCEVFGVEPNANMRGRGEDALAGYARFHSVNGRAEATGLVAGSFDLATAGQAFHWFDAAAARVEFQRILKPGGWVALIWNERRIAPGFMADYEALQDEYARERPHPTPDDFTAFFGHAEWRLAKIPNPQSLDETQLRARLDSSSWAPKPNSEAYWAMTEALRRLFQAHARDGQVVMEYETEAYYGCV
jgi:SAM-dependent methyltransferase